METLQEIMEEFNAMGHFSISRLVGFTEKCLKTHDDVDDDGDGGSARMPRKDAFTLVKSVLANPSGGMAEDYHDYAITFARYEYYTVSCDVLLSGLDRYPVNVDLLADFLAYAPVSSSDKHYLLCDEKYKLLKTRRSLWKWRAYQFSIDYLLDKINRGVSDDAEVKKECLNLASEFQERFPENEMAYYVEARVFSVFNEKENEKNALKKAFNNENVLILRTGLYLTQLCQQERQPEQAILYMERVMKDMPNVNNYTVSLSSRTWLLMIRSKIEKFMSSWKSTSKTGNDNKDIAKTLVKEIVEDWGRAKRIGGRDTEAYNEIKGLVEFVTAISGFDSDDEDL